MQREGHTAVESVPKAVTAVTEHRIQAEAAKAGVGESEEAAGPVAWTSE